MGLNLDVVIIVGFFKKIVNIQRWKNLVIMQVMFNFIYSTMLINQV